MTALVTGATGYIGSRLVAALRRAGEDVVAVSRRPEGLARFDWSTDVTTTKMDVTSKRSCTAAFDRIGDVDVAYYLVHAIGQSNYRDTDMRSARYFAEAARDAGVRRIVYLGGFVPHGEQLSEHLASRAEVGQALDVGGIEVVCLQAAIVLGAGSTSFEMLRYLSDRLPVVPLPTWLDKDVQPIAVDDVIHYLIESADDSLPPGSYDIAGADVMPYSELVFAYIRAAGLRRLGVPVPLVPMSLAAAVIGRIIPVPAGLAEDLVASLQNSMTAADDRIRSFIPDPPGGLTPVAEAMRRALANQHAVPKSIGATPDTLRLVDSDAEWTGGDEASIRRRAGEVLTRDGWKVLEGLGAGSLLYRWPVAPVVRTNLDVLEAVADRVRSVVRRPVRGDDNT